MTSRKSSPKARPDSPTRKRTEGRQEKQTEILEKLNGLLRLLTEDLTLEQSLERGLQIVLSASFLRLEQMGGVFLADPEKKELALKCSYNLPESLQTMCARVPFGHCLCGRAASSGEIQFSDCVDERHENRYAGIQPHGHYFVPIRANGKMFGVMTVYLPEKYSTDIFEVDFLRSAADIFAAIINRKQAEQALRESETRCRTIFEHANDGILITNADDKILAVNLRMCGILGYDRGQLLKMRVADLQAPEVRQSRDAIKNELARHGNALFEGLDLHRSGRRVPVEINIARFVRHQGDWYIAVVRDITERKRAEKAAEYSNRQIKSILECAGEGIFGLNVEGEHIFVNPAAANMLGYETADELVGLHSHSIWHYARPGGDPYPAEECPIYATLHDGDTHYGEDYFWRKDGSGFPVIFSSMPILENEKAVGAVVSFRDISERKREEEELRRAKDALETAHRELQQLLSHEQLLARTDSLTGLCNRRHFFELAAREFGAAMRYQRSLTILMFDADDFKQVNDILGHAAGDKVLALIAQAAAAQVRAPDVLARYGGDEFVILLSQTSAQQARPIAERIRKSVAAMRVETAKDPLAITLSIGIAETRREPPDESVERVIQRADEALYAAKQSGRNRTVIFNFRTEADSPEATGAPR